MMSRSIHASMLLLAGWFFVPASSAAYIDIPIGMYSLHNHSAGLVGPPEYGLRLDELFDVNPGQNDYFTFSFDHPGAGVTLNYTGDMIHIEGTVYGGLDTGIGYHPDHSGFWHIAFTYNGTVTQLPGDNDVVEAEASGVNTGTLTRLSDNLVIPLRDYNGPHPYTFRFGDDDDDLGHRGEPGYSGWGWLKHGDHEEYVAHSDWQFRASTMPEPTTFLGILTSLGWLVIGRRRRLR